MPQLDKSSLRHKIIRQRQSLSSTQWQEKSSLICDRISENALFKEAKTILAYFSFRQEADLTPLFSLNKNWGFPRCVGKSLVWHSWQPGAELQSGKYGIKEPLTTAYIIDPSVLCLILPICCNSQPIRGICSSILSVLKLNLTLIKSSQGNLIVKLCIVECLFKNKDSDSKYYLINLID